MTAALIRPTLTERRYRDRRDARVFKTSAPHYPQGSAAKARPILFERLLFSDGVSAM